MKIPIRPTGSGAFAPITRTILVALCALAAILTGCAEERASVSIRAVDAETGEPILEFQAGFKPGRVSGNSAWETEEHRRNGGTIDPNPPTLAPSISGSVVLKEVPVAKEMTVFVRAEGYALSRKMLDAKDRATRTAGLEVALTRAREIHGKVVDVNGRGIEGVVVGPGQVGMNDDTNEPLDRDASVTTSAAGSFTFSPLTDDHSILTAYHPDFAVGWMSFDDPAATITLENGVEVTGIVEGDMSELKDLHAECRCTTSTGEIYYWNRTDRIESDRFLFTDLPSVACTLKVVVSSGVEEPFGTREIEKILDLKGLEHAELTFAFRPKVTMLQGTIRINGEPSTDCGVGTRATVADTGEVLGWVTMSTGGGDSFLMGPFPESTATVNVGARDRHGKIYRGMRKVELRGTEPVSLEVHLRNTPNRIVVSGVEAAYGKDTSVYLFFGDAGSTPANSEWMRTNILMSLDVGIPNHDGLVEFLNLEPGVYSIVAQKMTLSGASPKVEPPFKIGVVTLAEGETKTIDAGK